MPLVAVAPVIEHRIPLCKALHKESYSNVSSFDQEMKVIVHETVCVNPARLLLRLALQDLQKDFKIHLILKNHLPANPSLHQMICRARIPLTSFSSHKSASKIN